MPKLRRSNEALAALIAARKRIGLEIPPVGSEPEEVYDWALRTFAGADDVGRTEVLERVKGVQKEPSEPWWAKALNKVSLPFEAFAEGVAGLFAIGPPETAPTQAIISRLGGSRSEFVERGKESREVIGKVFTGKISPAEAAGALREVSRKRPLVQQLAIGLLFDPTMYIPGTLIVKGVGKTVGLTGKVVKAPVKAVGKLVPTSKLPEVRVIGPRSVEEIFLESKETPLARLSARLPEWKEGQTRNVLGRAVRQSIEHVGLRGAVANRLGRLFLGFFEQQRQAEHFGAAAVEQLRPSWKAMSDIYDPTVSRFKLELKPNALSNPVAEELVEAGAKLGAKPEEVLTHVFSVLEDVPVEQLDNIYDLSMAQKGAILAYKAAVVAVTKDVDSKLAVYGKKLADFFKQEGKVAPPGPNYIPRLLAEKAEGLRRIRPGYVMKEADWLKARKIEDAATAIMNKINYADPLVGLQRYATEGYRLVGEVELPALLEKYKLVRAAGMAAEAFKDAKSLRRFHRFVKEGGTPLEERIAGLRQVHGRIVDDIASAGKGAGKYDDLVDRVVKDANKRRRAEDALRAEIVQPQAPIFRNTKFVFDYPEAHQAKAWFEEGERWFSQLASSGSSLNAQLRYLRANVDISMLLLQGLPTLIAHPALYGKALKNVVGNILQSKELRSLMAVRQVQRGAEYVQHGGVLGQVEFFEGTGRGLVGILEQSRGLGTVLTSIKDFYNLFLNELRLNLWEALRPIAKTPQDVADLGAHVNKMTGTYNTALAGLPALQGHIESLFVSFAPHYRRASFGLIADALQGTPWGSLRAKEAQIVFAKMLGAALAFGALVKVSGMNDGVFDPRSPRFMAAKVPGTEVYVGVGTAYYSLVRLAGQTAKLAYDDPGKLVRLGHTDNPLFKGWRSQAPILPARGLDFTLGRTYIGDPLRGRDGDIDLPNTAKWLLTSSLPFTFENALLSWSNAGSADFVALFSEGVGGRAFPVSPYERRQHLREMYVQTDKELEGWRSKNSGLGWYDLPVLFQRQIDERHADVQKLTDEITETALRTGRTLDRTLAEYRIALSKNRDFYNKGVKVIADTFERGYKKDSLEPVDARWFREELRKAGAAYRALQVSTANEEQFREAVIDIEGRKRKRGAYKTFLGDHLFELYMVGVVTNPDNYNSDGAFLQDEYESRDLAFATQFGTEMYDYVRARLRQGRDLPPIVTEYYDAVEKLRDYWGLHSTLWPEGSAAWELIDNYLAFDANSQAQMKQDFPQVRSLDKALRAAKERWRSQHPQEDWLLVKFFDNVPRTPFAAKKWNEWRS